MDKERTRPIRGTEDHAHAHLMPTVVANALASLGDAAACAGLDTLHVWETTVRDHIRRLNIEILALRQKGGD